MQTRTTYCFGDFEIQTGEHRLLVGGAQIPLGTRAFNLLLVLVTRAGQLVSKDTLLEEVWPDVVVEENNLQVQISTLRKLLGTEAIATVVGKGYRFTPEVKVKSQGVERVSVNSRNSLYKHSNLPHHLSELIGREDALIQLQGALSASRLVTVTGAGGVGKTRLMIATARTIETQFYAGVWLIELANLSDAQMVAATVAANLGLEVKDTKSATKVISHFVRDKQMLLLLDNCEHIVEAVATLIEVLLAVAPQLQIMTTSQEICGVTGEQVFRVPSLPIPEGAQHGAEGAMTFGAIKLFTERVRSVDPNFCCTDENVGEITAICRRLDGIPLAIEMAAARVSTLGLASVARLLDECFLALAAGRRSAVPRQRTLQATLDWSYGLLAPRERVVFRRIAAFVGGFSLAAAIAVGADDTLDQNEVIDAVSILVTKSLLTVDTSDGQRRYRLLEAARAYALERLAESGESDAVAQRAAEHFVATFIPCFDDWTRLSDDAFDARYLPDLNNVRLALDWAFLTIEHRELGLALLSASGPLWVGRLMITESDYRIDAALANLAPSTPPNIEAHLFLAAGSFYYWRLNEPARQTLQSAGDKLLALRETVAGGYARLMLGNALAANGDPRAESIITEAKSLLENCGRPRLLALIPKTLAMLAHVRCDYAATARENQRALALAQAGGYDVLALTIEENLADALWLTGDLTLALNAARNVIEKCKQMKISQRLSWGWIYGNLFGILVEADHMEEARAIGRIAMPSLREASTTRLIMDHFALRLAKDGLSREAALIHGWLTHYLDACGIKRQPNELRAANRTAELLREQLPRDVLNQLYADAIKLTEQDVCELALA